jgi:hypothetical protein
LLQKQKNTHSQWLLWNLLLFKEFNNKYYFKTQWLGILFYPKNISQEKRWDAEKKEERNISVEDN